MFIKRTYRVAAAAAAPVSLVSCERNATHVSVVQFCQEM